MIRKVDSVVWFCFKWILINSLFQFWTFFFFVFLCFFFVANVGKKVGLIADNSIQTMTFKHVNCQNVLKLHIDTDIFGRFFFFVFIFFLHLPQIDSMPKIRAWNGKSWKSNENKSKYKMENRIIMRSLLWASCNLTSVALWRPVNRNYFISLDIAAIDLNVCRTINMSTFDNFINSIFVFFFCSVFYFICSLNRVNRTNIYDCL